MLETSFFGCCRSLFDCPPFTIDPGRKEGEEKTPGARMQRGNKPQVSTWGPLGTYRENISQGNRSKQSKDEMMMMMTTTMMISIHIYLYLYIIDNTKRETTRERERERARTA